MGKSRGGGGGGSTTTVQPPRPNIPNEDLLMGSGLWRIHASSPYYSSPWRTMDFLQGYQAPSMQLPNFTGMNMFGQQPYGINGTQPGQAGMPMQGGGQAPGMGMPPMMGGWPMGGFGFGMPMQPPPMPNLGSPTQAGPGSGASLAVMPNAEQIGGAGPRPGSGQVLGQPVADTTPKKAEAQG